MVGSLVRLVVGVVGLVAAPLLLAEASVWAGWVLAAVEVLVLAVVVLFVDLRAGR
jgi:hypothetical protein